MESGGRKRWMDKMPFSPKDSVLEGVLHWNRRDGGDAFQSKDVQDDSCER